MVQFKDVLTGRETRSYKRAVNSQRCLRVAGKHNDFEEVGRTPRHHTLFEMLGNWSFGDYFKREAIHWAWELLTVDMGSRRTGSRRRRTRTTRSYWNVWRDEIGMPPERMARWGDVDAGDDKNFWRMAETGPCGPCSEIHFDRGRALSRGPRVRPGPLRDVPALAGDLEPRLHGVRPAAGRAAASRSRSRAWTRAWGWSAWRACSSRSPRTTTPTSSRRSTPDARAPGPRPGAFEAERFSYQVIADHSRAITFLVADGVLPEQRGARVRAAADPAARGAARPAPRPSGAVPRRDGGDGHRRHGRRHTRTCASERDRVLEVIRREEGQFARTLDAGTGQLEEALSRSRAPTRVVGRRAGDLPADAPVLRGRSRSGSTTRTASRST